MLVPAARILTFSALGSAPGTEALAYPTGPKVRPVGTRFNSLHSGFSPDGHTSTTYKTRHLIGTRVNRISGFQACWHNRKYPDNSTVETSAGLSPITLRASIQVGIQRIQLTFGGLTSFVLAPGARIWSDANPAIDALLASGIEYFIYTNPTVPAGGKWPVGLATNNGWGEGNNNNGGDATATGVITPTFASAYSPVAFRAYYDRATRSYGLLGDSICEGQNNNPQNVGYLELGLNDQYGLLKIAKTGDQAVSFANATNSTMRRQMLADAVPTDLIYQLGINDTQNSRPLEQMKTDAVAIWTWARGLGVERVHGCTLMPNVEWSGAKLTLDDQTPKNGNIARLGYNDWLRSGADGRIDRLIDAAAVTEYGGASEPSGKWLVDGVTPGLMANDGLHPSFYTYNSVLPPAVVSGLGLT